jgi:hypothetical protein
MTKIFALIMVSLIALSNSVSAQTWSPSPFFYNPDPNGPKTPEDFGAPHVPASDVTERSTSRLLYVGEGLPQQEAAPHVPASDVTERSTSRLPYVGEGLPQQEPESSANEAYAHIPPLTGEMLSLLMGRPTSLLYEWIVRLRENLLPSTPLLEPGEANKRYAPRRGDETILELFDQPIRERMAERIGLSKAREIERDTSWANYSRAHSAPIRMLVAGVGFLLDPVAGLLLALAVIFGVRFFSRAGFIQEGAATPEHIGEARCRDWKPSHERDVRDGGQAGRTSPSRGSIDWVLIEKTFKRLSSDASPRLPVAIYASWALSYLSYLLATERYFSYWYRQNSGDFWLLLLLPPTVCTAVIFIFRWAQTMRQAAGKEARQGEEKPNAPVSITADVLAIAAAEWAQIKDGSDLTKLNRFARHFAGTYHAELARDRIAELEDAARLAREEAERKHRLEEERRRQLEGSMKVIVGADRLSPSLET